MVRCKAFAAQMEVSLLWIYVHMSKLKPLGADWLVKAHQYLQNNTSLAKMDSVLQELQVLLNCKLHHACTYYLLKSGRLWSFMVIA